MAQMTPARLLNTAIVPALSYLSAVGIPDTPQARRFVLAIAMQESRIQHRRQVTDSGKEDGPANSFWQFERGGGCRGVLTHKSVMARMRRACIDFNVDTTEFALWEAMRYQDIVAAIAARLLIYTLPDKLPETPSEGWTQYLEAWRPGKPHLHTWEVCWETANKVISDN